MKLLMVLTTVFITPLVQADLKSQAEAGAATAVVGGAAMVYRGMPAQVSRLRKAHTTVTPTNKILTLAEQQQLTEMMDKGSTVRVKILLSAEESRNLRMKDLENRMIRAKVRAKELEREAARSPRQMVDGQLRPAGTQAAQLLTEARQQKKLAALLKEEYLSVAETPAENITRISKTESFVIGERTPNSIHKFLQESTARHATVVKVSRFSPQGAKLVARRMRNGSLGLVIAAAGVMTYGALQADKHLHGEYIEDNADVVEEFSVDR